MAKIKYSALVSDMRNKLNGSVLSKNRYGSYMRNKVTPVNPQSTAQLAARNRLASLSQNWRGLTQLQRDAWSSQVTEWSSTNIFGDVINPTGQTLYIKVNSNIILAGGSSTNTPPSKVGIQSLTAFSVAPDATGGTVVLTFAPTPVPANHALVIEATDQVSAGINFLKNRFRQIAVLPASTATGEDVINAYTAKFGSLQAGKKIGFRATLINSQTGERALPVSFNAIVA